MFGDHGLVRMASASEDGQRAVHHVLVPQLLDGHQGKLLQAVGDVAQLGIIPGSGRENPDVPGGDGDLARPRSRGGRFAPGEEGDRVENGDGDGGCVEGGTGDRGGVVV